MEKLLEVNNLRVEFALRQGTVKALRDVSFTVGRSERMGLVGESGAGKSITGFSIINLIPKPGYISDGNIVFEGLDLAGKTIEEIRDIRGNRISMIFQDPMMTLNPVLTIRTQMVETLKAHRDISDADAEEICLEKLRKVYMPSPKKRLDQYPHEFSGGQRQRIVIAIALLTDPSLIIADEPTTALDVTIQAEIMELLLELCKNEDMGLLLITHDLAVVGEVTQSIAVMYAGRIVETGSSRDLIDTPQHPYTTGLIAALPQSGASGEGRRLVQIPGIMPSLSNLPTGCSFHPRCELCTDRCKAEIPQLEKKSTGRQVACFMVK